MKKKVILIAIEKTAMDKYLLNLKSFFNNDIDIEGYFVLNQTLPGRIEGDLVLLTSIELTSTVRDNIKGNVNIIYLERTLLSGNLDCLFDEPVDTKMLFVDYTEQTANKMISLVTEFGIRNIDFFAVGKETSHEKILEKIDEGFKVAITPELASLIPIEVPNIIDIGWAIIDSKTLLEIAVMLGLYNEELEERLYLYTRKIITSSKSIMFYLKSTLESKNKYKTIIGTMDEGVVVFDNSGQITLCNDNFLRMFDLKCVNLATQNIREIKLPETLTSKILSNELLEEKLFYVTELKKNYIITKKDVNIFGELEESIIIINEIAGFQRKNAQIRVQMRENGYRAKYSFDDIIGNSDVICICKEKASKIARIDATVLITGESGTGKEMFAQSIHNESRRKEMPFVAINCAALTPSLLESELFGYEAGSFTNSKSEGHIGLFETAHKGTIFLDEIGEIPLDVQTKLLRVLEEKEIRRVGGKAIIPVDARVIAATNQDLYKLCEEKKFREDLYYRLNVLPLEVVPLRNRRQDIPIFVRTFLNNLNMSQKHLTSELMEILIYNDWKGNVRELLNCVQYIAYLGGDILDVDLLPPNFGRGADINNQIINAENILDGVFYYDEEKRISGYIMECLMNKNIGRRQIVNCLKSNGECISEYKIRTLINKLKESGYVEYSKGRAGVRLTELGYTKVKMDEMNSKNR